MTALSAALAGYALVLLWAGPAGLARARWAQRCPALGIAAWQAWTASVLLGLLGAGLTLVAGAAPRGGLAWLVRLCLREIAPASGLPGATVLGLFGLVGTAVLLARLLGVALWAGVRVARQRRSHHQRLALLCRPCPGGFSVVDHTEPLAYCLPGRRRRIVISTAAQARLDDGELAAVLAHERAHLAGRHHWALFAAATVARAFPLPALRRAREETAVLVEMAADDAARSACGRQQLAGALAALAGAAAPAGTMAAAQLAVGRRFQRLQGETPPLPAAARRLGWAGLALAVLAPVALSVAAIGASAAEPAVYCPTADPVAAAASATAASATGATATSGGIYGNSSY